MPARRWSCSAPARRRWRTRPTSIAAWSASASRSRSTRRSSGTGAASDPARLNPTLRGVLWMSGAVLSFCAMAIAARELLSHVSVFAILFYRTTVALLIVLAVALPRGTPLGTKKIRIHLWRNLFHLGGQWSWVYAIGALPLATVFAIEFTAPIFTALLAVFLLGERMNAGRVVMLALGFAGVLAILRPGLAAVAPAAIVMI